MIMTTEVASDGVVGERGRCFNSKICQLFLFFCFKQTKHKKKTNVHNLVLVLSMKKKRIKAQPKIPCSNAGPVIEGAWSVSSVVLPLVEA